MLVTSNTIYRNSSLTRHSFHDNSLSFRNIRIELLDCYRNGNVLFFSHLIKTMLIIKRKNTLIPWIVRLQLHGYNSYSYMIMLWYAYSLTYQIHPVTPLFTRYSMYKGQGGNYLQRKIKERRSINNQNCTTNRLDIK